MDMDMDMDMDRDDRMRRMRMMEMERRRMLPGMREGWETRTPMFRAFPGTTDMAMATRDATQTVPMVGPLGSSWWEALIQQIQQLFTKLTMLLSEVESHLDTNLMDIERTITMNPNITPEAKEKVMDRLDASQMKIDKRFDMARMNLMAGDTRTAAELAAARMRLMMEPGRRVGQYEKLGLMPPMRPVHPPKHTLGMVDVGGGDLIPVKIPMALTRTGTMMLPPGLADRIIIR
jgi:hypothetical protein